MRDNPLLELIFLALVFWLVWFWFKGGKKGVEEATRRKQEKRARHDAEEADKRRKAAEADSAAWRVEVAEDARRRQQEKKRERVLHQEERAERLEQERRARKVAMEGTSWRQETEAAARHRAEGDRADQLDEVAGARRLMRQHITMLAAMRRQRPDYEVAVSDWEADVAWLQEVYGDLAERLRRAGIG